MKPGKFVNLKSDFLTKVENIADDLGYSQDEIITWTTDGFFRETPRKVAQFRQLGACAQFRKIDFAQILFTGDTLVNMDNYDRRNWGRSSYSEIGANILIKI